MSQMGKAYVEVLADFKRFPAEFRRDLKAAIHEGMTGVEFDGFAEKGEKAGHEAADKLGDAFERRSKARLRKAGEEGGKSLLGGLKSLFTRDSGKSGGFLSSIGGFFSDLTSGIRDSVSSAFSGGGGISALSGPLSSLGSIGGDIGGVLKIAVITAAIPVVLGLAGAVIQLGAALFALPAAAGVGLAFIAPLIIAFKGVGEALGAGLSGDTKAFKEALKGLAPTAQKVVKEIVKLGPQLKRLKRDIQNNFFDPLVGVVGPALDVILAGVGPGLKKVSAALGGVATSLVAVFADTGNVTVFGQLLDSTARIAKTLEPALANLAQAMINLIAPALPFLERMTTGFRDFAAHVEGFTRKISTNGQLAGWLSKAADIMHDLGRVTANTTKFLIDLLGGEIGDQGAKFISMLADVINYVDEFLHTAEGGEAIHNLATLTEFFGRSLIVLLHIIPDLLIAMNAVFDFFRGIGPFFRMVGGEIADAANKVGDFFAKVGGVIADFFTQTIPAAFDTVKNFFSAIPGQLVSAGGSLKATLVGWAQDAFGALTDFAFNQVGRLIGVFLAVPQLILHSLDAAPGLLGSFFSALWDQIVSITTTGVDNTLSRIGALPSQIGSFAGAIYHAFVDMITAAVNAVTGVVESGFNSAVNLVASLPGRVRSFGSALYNAAVSLGHAIGDGLSNIGNFASDIGKRIVSTVKSGVNSIIGSINSGISDIDSVLPGSLPRIPFLAKGAVIDSPTLAMVGEAGKEVVIPLGDPARAQQLARESGLLSILKNNGGTPTVNVTNVLDGGMLTGFIRSVVDVVMGEQGRELAYGART